MPDGTGLKFKSPHKTEPQKWSREREDPLLKTSKGRFGNAQNGHPSSARGGNRGSPHAVRIAVCVPALVVNREHVFGSDGLTAHCSPSHAVSWDGQFLPHGSLTCPNTICVPAGIQSLIVRTGAPSPFS